MTNDERIRRAKEAYQKAKQQAWEAYYEAQPVWEAYQKTEKQAWEVYQKAIQEEE